ncbi:MAG: MmgE/PrpD family protein [bacterium]
MEPITRKAPVLAEIAKFIADPPTINERTMNHTRRIFADTYGVAHSGITTPAFELAMQSRQQLFGGETIPIWGTDKKSSLLGATFYNALAVSSTDFDEGHRKAVGHPASLVVPVAENLGKYLDKPFTEVLRAIVVGYEIGTRFSFARNKDKITTYSSGRWGGLAAAAAASVLLGLSVEKIMHALSLATILSPAMLGGASDVSTGSMSKEGVAWAAQSGLQSALLAENGFVGPYLFLDQEDEFQRNKLLDSLGENWSINSNYFKPYACCRWLHTGIKAAFELKGENKFDPHDIEKIEIRIFDRAFKLISSKYPENPIQAQFHLPYVIACALLFDQVAPKQFTAFYLKNTTIHNLINKIKMIPDKKYTNIFPTDIPVHMSIRLPGDRVLEREVLNAPWDRNNHPDDEHLKQKFVMQVGENGETAWNEIMGR